MQKRLENNTFLQNFPLFLAISLPLSSLFIPLSFFFKFPLSPFPPPYFYEWKEIYGINTPYCASRLSSCTASLANQLFLTNHLKLSINQIQTSLLNWLKKDPRRLFIALSVPVPVPEGLLVKRSEENLIYLMSQSSKC